MYVWFRGYHVDKQTNTQTDTTKNNTTLAMLRCIGSKNKN